MKLSKEMKANFFALVANQGVAYLLPLMAYPFLYRKLGEEYFGIYAFGWYMIQLLITITDFGFNLSAVKFISVNKENRDAVNRYLNGAYIVRILLGTLCFIVLLGLVLFVAKFNEHPAFFLLFFGVVIGNIMSPFWFFQGMEKMTYITIFNLIAKLGTFIPIFIVIRGPEDYLWISIFYSVGYCAAGFICLYFVYVKEKMKWFFPKLKEVKEVMKDSSTYFLSRLSLSLFTYMNGIVLGWATNFESVSYYSRAEMFYKAYNMLLAPVQGVLFPHMSKTKDVPFFKKIFYSILKINTLLVVLTIVLAAFLITTIYADSSVETIHVFRILICGCLITIPSMLFGYPLLAALGHEKYTNLTIVVVSLIHVVAIILLYSFGWLSIYSMAMMVVISEVLLFLFRLRGVVKYKLLKC